MYGQDSSTAPIKYFIHSQSGVNNLTFQTSDTDTAVFLENWNTNGHLNWNTMFSSNLSATAKVSTTGAVTWENWDNDFKKDKNCFGIWNDASLDMFISLDFC